MVSQFRRRASVLAICLSCLLQRGTASEDVAIEDNSGRQETEVVVNDLSNNNDSYWTAEKLNSAKPYPLPTRNISHVYYEHLELNVTTNQTHRLKRDASEWDITGAKPAPLPSLTDAQLAKLGIKPRIKVAGARETLAGARVEVANVNDQLFSPMGKLFFVDNQGSGYQCSGQYVADYIVMTAGHCVYSLETKGWNKHFRFVQNYNGKLGRRKYEGTPRRVSKAIVGKKWFSSGEEDFAYDFAFLSMKDPSVGGHYEIDYPEKFTEWINAGYPSNYDNGEVLRQYRGKRGRESDASVETPGSPMGPGCSGGAWIAQKGSQNYVVGVNSYSIEGRQSMFSPHLTPSRVDSILVKAKDVAAKG